jgi:hypothetical protein
MKKKKIQVGRKERNSCLRFHGKWTILLGSNFFYNLLTALYLVNSYKQNLYKNVLDLNSIRKIA